MTDEAQFQSAQVQSLNVLLKPGFDLTTLRAAFSPMVAGQQWLMAPVRPGEGRSAEFDLVPPPGEALSAQGAWELTRQLLALAFVEDAEPVFEVDYSEPSIDEEPSDAGFEAFGAKSLDEDSYDWSARFIDAHGAWTLKGGAASYGKGVRIGHPDSGYVKHRELGPNYKAAEGRDFIDGDATVENPQGGHGLSTASVISSPHDHLNPAGAGASSAPFVAGIAPEAEVIPFRVARPHGIIPSPILFKAGAQRLRDAIWHAVDIRVHVISISLGWFPNRTLHQAIKHAVSQNIIIVAAAGNYTGPIVVWPAAYDEVIAMAACNSRGKPWRFSAFGRAVDATAPGEKVWTAQPGERIEKSSGTSHATATVAGVAALWLAHHGRDNLLEMYKNGPTLSEVFRQVLQSSCDSWGESRNRFGAGLVNARACLETPLPAASGLQSFGSALASKGSPDTVSGAFSGVEPGDVHKRLARALQVDPSRVPDLERQHGRELRFWALTDPAFREAILQPSPEAEQGFESFGAGKSHRAAPLSRFSSALSAALAVR